VEHQGVSSNQERAEIVDLHNRLRAKLANGFEGRGDPGPQMMAANMMNLVRFFRFFQ
jgi:hypothetical protein